jgi:hypothetical protein
MLLLPSGSGLYFLLPLLPLLFSCSYRDLSSNLKTYSTLNQLLLLLLPSCSCLSLLLLLCVFTTACSSVT